MEGEKKGHRSTYKDAAISFNGKARLAREEEADDGAIFDDDVIEESIDPSWFGNGMTQEEKWRARQPWWNSPIIKLVVRSIVYHYLWRRIQAIRRTNIEPLLIDLGSVFYNIKLFGYEEYDRAMTEGP